jgi:membrane protein
VRSYPVTSVVRWPILVVLIMAGLAALYRFGPCRAEARWRWVSGGAAAATVLDHRLGALLDLCRPMRVIRKSYGSLGAVVILLM